MTFLNRITDNLAYMQEYLSRILRQEYRLKYRQERLLQERAMIEAELKHIQKELQYCEQEKNATQYSIAEYTT
jgi:regulator of replication initiation timing